MNRNKQLHLNLVNYDVQDSDDIIEFPVLSEGKIVVVRKSVKDHYSQYDPKAFSLQSISDCGLLDELKTAPFLSGDSLDILDSFGNMITKSDIVDHSAD